MERIERIRIALEWWEELVPNLQYLTQSIADEYRKEIADYELSQTNHIYGDATPIDEYAARTHTI